MQQEKHKKKYETLHIESIQQIYTMPAKLQTLLMLQYNAPSCKGIIPPIDLYLIFEKSSLKNQVERT